MRQCGRKWVTSGCQQCRISVNLRRIGNRTSDVAAQFGICFAASHKGVVTFRCDKPHVRELMCGLEKCSRRPVFKPNGCSLQMTQNRTGERIEAWLSAFTGTLLSFVFLLAVVLPNQWALQIPLPLFLLLLFTLVYFLEGRFLIQLWVCTFCGRIPIGPAVAARIR